MYKKNQLIFTFTFILGLTFISCKSTESDGENPGKKHRLKIEQIKIEKESDGCKKENLQNCAELKIEYPKLIGGENNKAVDDINENIKLQLLQPILDEGEYDSLDSLIDAYFKEFNIVAEENPKLAQGWQIDRIIQTKNQTKNILSIEYSDYSFLGGAHPNSYIAYSNYYLATGEQVSLDECFIKSYEEQLNTIGEIFFRKQKNLKENSDLSSAGYWFDENKFELNDNFAILKVGLLFYYNSYEIAPYAIGPTELVIPYSEIKQLILTNGPLSEFIKS